ncbi:hypothetical protein DV701_07570 [Ornithinimicrobium avium]|uniref:Uncharacterized protein n=2 Tax=Ornithinimicrobium avium TaxID=2283195 RepID=A0A345NLU6_9MICO|nr:hypothetical protein DV701_07570 [Ornithinimicrobium avium]
MPRPTLFARVGSTPESACVWVGERLETSEALGSSFLEAADALGELWLASHASSDRDRLAIPIVQTYRHAIELLLKAACEKAAELVGFSRYLGYGEDVRPADLQDRLGQTHSIARLVELLSTLTGGIDSGGSGELPPETKDALKYLHDQDERGLAFRYASRKVGKGESAHWAPVRPTLMVMDLENAITELHGAAQMIEGGLMTYLHEYESFLQERLSEHEAAQVDNEQYDENWRYQ